MTTNDIITQYAHLSAKIQALQAQAQMAVDADPAQHRYLKHMGVRRMLISTHIKALFIRIFLTLWGLIGSAATVYYLNVHDAGDGAIIPSGIALLFLNVAWIVYIWGTLKLYGKDAFE